MREITNSDREMFLKNIRFLYERTPLKNLGKELCKKEWENNFGAEGKGFPLADSTYYGDIFRTKKEMEKIKFNTMRKAMEVLNPYLKEPYEFRLDGSDDFSKFVSYEFTDSKHPEFKASVFGNFTKYLQDYYIYCTTERPNTLSLGVMSLFKTSAGIKAVLLSHFRNMSEIYEKEKIWNVLSELDEDAIRRAYHETYCSENNNQPICRLFFADKGDVKFTDKYMKINFKGRGEAELYLDISNTVKREDLHYQFGCGTLTTHMNSETPSRDCSHIILVTATDNPSKRVNLEGKREEGFISNILDPLPCDSILKAVEYCDLKYLSASAKTTEDFYKWTKLHNIERLRKQRKKNDFTKAELRELIERLQQLYDKLEE